MRKTPQAVMTMPKTAHEKAQDCIDIIAGYLGTTEGGRGQAEAAVHTTFLRAEQADILDKALLILGARLQGCPYSHQVSCPKPGHHECPRGYEKQARHAHCWRESALAQAKEDDE